MIQEFMESKNTRTELSSAFKEFAAKIKTEKDHFKILDKFSDNLSAALSPIQRLKAVKIIDKRKMLAQ